MMGRTLGELTAEIRENNIRKGFRPADGGPGENTRGDYLALLHSEISEALEAYRDHRLADATAERRGISLHGLGRTDPDAPLPKPEGVGSEFADVLIRLLDMCDVFGMTVFDLDMALGDVADCSPDNDNAVAAVKTFGDWMAWLHYWAAEMGLTWAYSAPFMLRALVATARHFGIDLEAEVERKIAYNATRPYQHGGRMMADAGPSPEQRFTALVNAIPEDPRDWWISEETEWFLDAWESLGLPRLTMQDASGERLTLWCSDVGKAAEMLGAELTAGGIELCKGEYSVGIVQAEKGRRDA